MPMPGRPRPFPPWTTALWGLAWLWVMLHTFSDRHGVEPLSWRAYPVASAQRMVNRELELATAADAASGGLAQLANSLHATTDDALTDALFVHWDLIEHLEQRAIDDDMLDRARLQYALLLAEAADLEEAFAVAELARDGESLIAVLAAIYLEEYEREPIAGDAIGYLASRGIEDWMLERATIQLLESRHHTEAAREIAAETLSRGNQWWMRSSALSIASFACIISGLVLLLSKLIRRDVPFRLDSGTVAPWDLETGIAVLVRGDFWNQTIFIALGQAVTALPDSRTCQLLYEQGEPLAALPMLWLVYQHLLRPVGTAAADGRALLHPFGLDSTSWQPRLMISVTLIAVAIDLSGSSLLSYAATSLSSQGHWAEGFDEMLVWGSPAELTQSILNYMLWTPLVEELTFRGLLYYSLRRRFGAMTAALLSASIFSLVHFYSLPGLLTTFWSGLVWGLAFERTRSLWPGIVAHAIYNGVYVAGLVLIYR